MKDPVNWGVVGAANFARHHMGPAIHAAHGARLAAIATSYPVKAEPFAEFAPGLRVHTEYDALLADPDIDAIYLPLPNHLHVEWTKKALEAGKHVLCEKPIAMQASDIDGLIAARDASGRFATEAFMIVHHPQWQRARELYRDGAIGDMAHVEGLFAYDNRDGDNIRNRPETGGGGIPDIGVYTFGCTRWLTGKEPEEITHVDVEFENGVDVRSRVSARFSGFSAHWMNSMRMHPVQDMTFIGTDGVLKLTAPFNANVFGQAQVELHRGMTCTVERFPDANHYVLQVENFCAHIREGEPYAWSLEDARGTQAMIDTVFAKARE